MNASKVVALFFISLSALAEDGMVIQFTIEESKIDSPSSQRYTNAVLMKMNETATFKIDDLYSVKFQTSSTDQKNVNVVFTLKDLSDGKPYYIGAKPIDTLIGDSSNIELQNAGSKYKITLDTSYGKLP